MTTAPELLHALRNVEAALLEAHAALTDVTRPPPARCRLVERCDGVREEWEVVCAAIAKSGVRP